MIRRCVKDPIPALSHWAGALLALCGTIGLLVLARGRMWHVLGLGVYGLTLVLLYVASGVAHTIRCSAEGEERLTRLDYMAIFLLIAGTYTPLCLVTMRGPWGWGMLAAEWLMAAAGILLITCGRGNATWPRTILYLVMAWIVALVCISPISHALPADALGWLLIGGAIYSVGAIIFATDHPHLWPGRFVAHDLWHLLVLAGSACHFFVIYRFVAAA